MAFSLIRPGRLLGFLALCSVATAAAADPSPFLWEAVGENGKAYLLGSIHVGKPEFYPLPEAVENAFAGSDKLVVEVNLSKEEEASMGMKMLMAGVYRDGNTLEGQVAPETWEKFAAFLDERGVPSRNFQSMRPWMAALVLSVTEMQKLGFDPQLGIDRHFITAANETGKPIEQLESADFQIEMLSGFSEELQEKFLVHTLRDMGRFGEVIGDMATAWKTGDDEAMNEMMFGDVGFGGGLEELGDRMINERNHTMADKIAAMIDAGGVSFVVVGAGHLIGEEGVPTLLATGGQGITVARVGAAALPMTQ